MPMHPPPPTLAPSLNSITILISARASPLSSEAVSLPLSFRVLGHLPPPLPRASPPFANAFLAFPLSSILPPPPCPFTCRPTDSGLTSLRIHMPRCRPSSLQTPCPLYPPSALSIPGGRSARLHLCCRLSRFHPRLAPPSGALSLLARPLSFPHLHLLPNVALSPAPILGPDCAPCRTLRPQFRFIPPLSPSPRTLKIASSTPSRYEASTFLPWRSRSTPFMTYIFPSERPNTATPFSTY